MKLLLLFDYYHPYIGGAEIVNQKIAEHLNATHDVTVVSKKFAGCLDAQSVVNGVRIFRSPDVPRLCHSVTAALHAMPHAREADIILCATYASALAGHILSKMTRRRSVLLVHEILDENWQYFKTNHRLYRCYERFVVTRKFDRYIVFSDYTKKKLSGCGVSGEKITRIYHGIEQGLFSPRPIDGALRRHIAGDAAFVYLYFGRPGGSKGLEYLLAASVEISRKIEKSRLVMILPSEPRPEYNRIMALISKLGLKDHIRVMPPVQRTALADCINVADVVVVPSLSEGFGFSAAESCRLGKAVVVTDAGSLPEVVSGRVVKVRKADSGALVEGIYRAWQGDFEMIAPKNFSWDRALKAYDRVLDELIRT